MRLGPLLIQSLVAGGEKEDAHKHHFTSENLHVVALYAAMHAPRQACLPGVACMRSEHLLSTMKNC